MSPTAEPQKTALLVRGREASGSWLDAEATILLESSRLITWESASHCRQRDRGPRRVGATLEAAYCIREPSARGGHSA